MVKLNELIINKYISKLCGLNYNEIEISSIRFMIEVILGEIEKLIILLVVFVSLGKFREFVVCLIPIGTLRLFLGGYHLKTFYSCLVFTIIYFLIVIYVLLPMPIKNIGFIICYICSTFNIISFAPVSSKNRQFSKNEKRIIKIKAMAILVILFIICFINVSFKSYIVSGLALQQVEIVVVKIIEIKKGMYMINQFTKKTSEMLIRKTRMVLKDTGSLIFWGEPTLPDSLKSKYAAKKKEDK